MTKILTAKDYYQLINELSLQNDPVERVSLLKSFEKIYSELNTSFRYSFLKHLDELISEKEYRFCQMVDSNPQMSYDQIALGNYPYQCYLQIREEIKSLDSGTMAKQGNNLFSALEWATIFYYADDTNLLPDLKTTKARMQSFMTKHDVKTTLDNFKSKYYEAKRRINIKNNYPIAKLDSIIPFLKENYPQTVTKVENEKTFLKEEQPD